MSFNYEKFKSNAQASDQQWSSYSDLFMVLTVVFLLLYVNSSLKGGTSSVKNYLENQKLLAQVEDLKQQIKVYDTLKEQYLNEQASEKEQEVYEDLMSKLTLLQDESKEKRSKLEKQVRETRENEQALNQYQQIIRNIINSNMLAKNKVKRRDKIIQKKSKVIQKNRVEIAKKKQEVRQLEAVVEQKKSIISEREKQMADIDGRLQKKISELEKSYRRNLITEKRMNQMVTKLKEESEKSIAELAQKNSEIRSQLTEVNKNLKTASEEIERKEREKARLVSKEKKLNTQLGSLKSKIKESQKQLKRARELVNARKKLAKQIKSNFAKAGIKAEVDDKNGDVILAFDGEYFDTGKASLKSGMKKILKKFMPSYSESLLGDEKVAKLVDTVEIIGFASPTYGGKYIDPNSLDSKDRKAVNYNLDLSYQRAKGIFNYIFDTKKMKYKYQKDLLPRVKVTGRSFLAESKGNRKIASGVSKREFCKQYDCKKAQRVIIKFNLKD